MANVTPEVPPSGYQEEYVLCSGVRSGLKREFAFALKAQAEMLVAPMGRTRSGKIQHSSVPSREPGAKRRKKLEGPNSPSGMLSSSENTRILPGSEDVESLGVDVVVEAAMPVGADAEQMEVATSNADSPTVQNNGSVGDTSVAMQIESMPVLEMPQAVQIEVEAATENVPSIPVDEMSVKEASQTNYMEEGSGREEIPSTHARPVQKAPQMNHVEEGASTEKVPSIQVYARPVQKVPPRNHVEDAASTEKVPIIQVYTRPAVKVSKRHHVEEGSLTENVQSVKAYTRPVLKVPQTNHIEEGALTEKVPSIRVYGRPVVKMPQTNHVKGEALIGKVPSIQVYARPLVKVTQGDHVEEVSKEKVPSIQASVGSVMKVPQANRVEEGASTENISSIQVDASPVVKVPQANHLEARASTENTSSIQVDASPVVKVLQANHVEEGASAENISSIQVDASPVAKVPQTNHVNEGASTENVPSTQVDVIPVAKAPQTNHVNASPLVKVSQTNHVEEGASTENVSSVQVDANPMVKVRQMNHVEEEAASTVNISSMQVDTGPVVKIPLTNHAEEWPMTDFPNSTVLEIPAEIDSGVSQKIEENALAEEPMRRFTRSVLKTEVKEPAFPIVEESPVLTAEASLVANGGSASFEEIKDSADTVNASDEPLRVTPKRKMELKMSKKIALSKFPSNIRDLLATGLLEGLPVKYLIHSYDKVLYVHALHHRFVFL